MPHSLPIGTTIILVPGLARDDIATQLSKGEAFAARIAGDATLHETAGRGRSLAWSVPVELGVGSAQALGADAAAEVDALLDHDPSRGSQLLVGETLFRVVVVGALGRPLARSGRATSATRGGSR